VVRDGTAFQARVAKPTDAPSTSSMEWIPYGQRGRKGEQGPRGAKPSAQEVAEELMPTIAGQIAEQLHQQQVAERQEADAARSRGVTL